MKVYISNNLEATNNTCFQITIILFMSLWYGKLYFYLSFLIDITSLMIYIAQNLVGIKLFNEYAKSMKMTKFYTNEAVVDAIFLSTFWKAYFGILS